ILLDLLAQGVSLYRQQDLSRHHLQPGQERLGEVPWPATFQVEDTPTRVVGDERQGNLRAYTAIKRLVIRIGRHVCDDLHAAPFARTSHDPRAIAAVAITGPEHLAVGPHVLTAHALDRI